MGKELSIHALIIGGGASGLLCALTAARQGKGVIIIEHRQRLGDRVAIAGGGMCNFSNRRVSPEDYVSANPRFLHSPLAAFPPDSAIRFFSDLGIRLEEREYGQLFSLQGGDVMRNALIQANLQTGVTIQRSKRVETVYKEGEYFFVLCGDSVYKSKKLVLACGGLSYPKLGASDLGYRLAKQFGHQIVPTMPGLVPLIFNENDIKRWSPLAGISIPVNCTVRNITFSGDLLFTHKGISGPVILTISNHWQKGSPLTIDWLPGLDINPFLSQWKQKPPKASLRSCLIPMLPKRILDVMICDSLLKKCPNQLSRSDSALVQSSVHKTQITPLKSDGYEKAEVTKGGVDTRGIDNKTMQSRIVPGLHIIGELLDVTGNLGGYNLHWAWASGYLTGHSL